MVYEMSIESDEFKIERNGFHLGTDERLARKLIEERFAGRIKANMKTTTIALMQGGKIVDVYDGLGWRD